MGLCHIIMLVCVCVLRQGGTNVSLHFRNMSTIVLEEWLVKVMTISCTRQEL